MREKERKKKRDPFLFSHNAPRHGRKKASVRRGLLKSASIRIHFSPRSARGFKESLCERCTLTALLGDIPISAPLDKDQDHEITEDGDHEDELRENFEEDVDQAFADTITRANNGVNRVEEPEDEPCRHLCDAKDDRKFHFEGILKI